jgi:CRISPR-associated protein Csb2
LFQALVDAHYDADGDTPSTAERDTLEWLESLYPPVVVCSAAAERAVLTHFVPVNDVRPGKLKENESLKSVVKKTKEGLAVLVDTRLKQPRFFPTVVPEHPVVYFQWAAELTTDRREDLKQILRRVVRVGHSSSFVQCSLVDVISWPEHLTPFRFLPVEGGGDISLRTPFAGRLAALDHAFDHGLYPPLLRGQGYVLARDVVEEDAPPHSQYEPSIIVLRTANESGGLAAPHPLTQSLRWAKALRGLLLRRGDQELLPEASGHDSPGEKMEREHLAIVPLPFVDSRHADGHLLGMGIVLPRDAKGGELETNVLELLQRGEIKLQHRWSLQFEQRHRSLPPRSLRTETYSGGSRGCKTWASLTPMVLDKHLKTKVPKTRDSAEREEALRTRDEEIIESIRRSVKATGLPMPDITIAQAPFLRGVPHVSSFPRDSRGRLCRYHTHVKLVFPEPVQGPILLGSGRFRGYGFFKPVRDDESVYSDRWYARIEKPKADADVGPKTSEIRHWLSSSGKPEPRSIIVEDRGNAVWVRLQFMGLVKGPLRWRGAGFAETLEFRPDREQGTEGEKK